MTNAELQILRLAARPGGYRYHGGYKTCMGLQVVNELKKLGLIKTECNDLGMQIVTTPEGDAALVEADFAALPDSFTPHHDDV